MFFDTIRLLVRNENWPKANLHVTKENKSFKKKEVMYHYKEHYVYFYMILNRNANFS